MKLLRTLHLYLGCIYAPMLILFAISGMFQTLMPKTIPGNNHVLAWLWNIHTSHALKIGNLSSVYLRWFIVTMSLSLMFTIGLGIFMAFKFGHKRTAIGCLLGGILVPVIFIALAAHR